MRVLRWGAFVSWLIVAGLAVGGFAAFSPRPVAEDATSTSSPAIADGRGGTAGRILAGAFASAAADRSYLSTSSSAPPPRATPTESSSETTDLLWPSGSECLASFYGPGFEGKPTANGESFDSSDFTAALHEVPFDTVVTVTRVDTGAATIVRINDRGPYEWRDGRVRHPTRCIDLSVAAMEALGGIDDGVIPVTISY